MLKDEHHLDDIRDGTARRGSAISVVIVEDHALFRKGLQLALAVGRRTNR